MYNSQISNIMTEKSTLTAVKMFLLSLVKRSLAIKRDLYKHSCRLYELLLSLGNVPDDIYPSEERLGILYVSGSKSM